MAVYFTENRISWVYVQSLGLFTYAAVPALQARLIKVAELHAPKAQGVAAGLNIAGFNSGIALGSLLGGVTIANLGLEYVGLIGAMAALIGLWLVLIQVSASRNIKTPVSIMAN